MNLQGYLPHVDNYLRYADLSAVDGWRSGVGFTVAPLAQGEYNMNYLVRQGGTAWVLRVNVGTQIDRDDQVLYEYRVLSLFSALFQSN